MPFLERSDKVFSDHNSLEDINLAPQGQSVSRVTLNENIRRTLAELKVDIGHY